MYALKKRLAEDTERWIEKVPVEIQRMVSAIQRKISRAVAGSEWR